MSQFFQTITFFSVDISILSDELFHFTFFLSNISDFQGDVIN